HLRLLLPAAHRRAAVAVVQHLEPATLVDVTRRQRGLIALHPVLLPSDGGGGDQSSPFARSAEDAHGSDLPPRIAAALLPPRRPLPGRASPRPSRGLSVRLSLPAPGPEWNAVNTRPAATHCPSAGR